MRRDLPVGTPKADVESYLTRENIPHAFLSADKIYGHDDSLFHAVLRNIGIRVIFSADLSIWIHIDQNDRLREIRSRIQYDAP